MEVRELVRSAAKSDPYRACLLLGTRPTAGWGALVLGAETGRDKALAASLARAALGSWGSVARSLELGCIGGAEEWQERRRCAEALLAASRVPESSTELSREVPWAFAARCAATMPELLAERMEGEGEGAKGGRREEALEAYATEVYPVIWNTLEQGLRVAREAAERDAVAGRAERRELEGRWTLQRAIVSICADLPGEARKRRFWYESHDALCLRPQAIEWAWEKRDRMALLANAGPTQALRLADQRGPDRVHATAVLVLDDRNRARFEHNLARSTAPTLSSLHSPRAQ
jgi:hypothetical protein